MDRLRSTASRSPLWLTGGRQLVRSGRSILSVAFVPAEGSWPVLAESCLLRRDYRSCAQIL
jgi:hypothetical protein